MENIIKKSIEGGYELGWKQGLTLDIACRVIVCDPLFWQALGKACGWESKSIFYHCVICSGEDLCWVTKGFCRKCGNEQTEIEKETTRHIEFALKFHEINLTQGWDKAVEYLQGLIA